MSSLQKFPFHIVETHKISGRLSSDFFGSGRDESGLIEIVIDEHRHPWMARSGMLCPMGTKYGEVPNYQDPRTAYHAVCVGDNPDEVTHFAWLTETGDVVEECPVDGEDPLADIPPDRRSEWSGLLAQVQ